MNLIVSTVVFVAVLSGITAASVVLCLISMLCYGDRVREVDDIRRMLKQCERDYGEQFDRAEAAEEKLAAAESLGETVVDLVDAVHAAYEKVKVANGEVYDAYSDLFEALNPDDTADADGDDDELDE
jgi:uncharacterized protein (DUF3084 family)